MIVTVGVVGIGVGDGDVGFGVGEDEADGDVEFEPGEGEADEDAEFEPDGSKDGGAEEVPVEVFADVCPTKEVKTTRRRVVWPWVGIQSPAQVVKFRKLPAVLPKISCTGACCGGYDAMRVTWKCRVLP